jgi:hypothetical protein
VEILEKPCTLDALLATAVPVQSGLRKTTQHEIAPGNQQQNNTTGAQKAVQPSLTDLWPSNGRLNTDGLWHPIFTLIELDQFFDGDIKIVGVDANKTPRANLAGQTMICSDFERRQIAG